MRKLTTNEYSSIIVKLNKHIKWAAYREAALKLFGPDVYKVRVYTNGEYDDEGGTDYFIEDMIGYTKDGKEIEQNQQVFIDAANKFVRGAWEIGEDDISDARNDFFSELPVDKYTDIIIVGEAPELPELYINE